VLTLMLVFVSANECVTTAMTPEQKACCAAMKGDCEMSVSSPCCPPETQESQSFLAAKPTIAVVPVAVLVAVLGVPPVSRPSAAHTIAPPDASSSGPPGVPTYLFVSSFRI
jgi:hypothetical protein